MKAAVMRAARQPLTIEELELAPPQTGEVRVRLLATGVCHTDVMPLDGQMPLPTPVVLGHEGVGEIVELGPNVNGLVAGDRVMLTQIVCGRCWFCARGDTYLCELKKAKLISGGMLDGTGRLRDSRGAEVKHFFCQSSFAEEAVVDQRGVVRIAADIPPHVVAPLSCGAGTGIGAVLNIARPEVGSMIAVFGCGGVGLSAVLAAAHLAKAARVIAIDVVPHKLELAAAAGASDVVDARSVDVVAEIRRLTKGFGVDCAIECSGNAGAIANAWDCTRLGGVTVAVGVPPWGTQLNLNSDHLVGSKTLTGCSSGNVRPSIDLPRWIELYRQGRFPLDRLVTHTFPLEQINEAIDALHEGRVGRGVLVMN